MALQPDSRLVLVETANGSYRVSASHGVSESRGELARYGGAQAANQAVASLLSRAQDFFTEQVQTRQFN